MERQGLHFAVHIIPAVKDGRLGYAHAMEDFVERMMVKSGTVNEVCGELPPIPPAVQVALRTARSSYKFSSSVSKARLCSAHIFLKLLLLVQSMPS